MRYIMKYLSIIIHVSLFYVYIAWIQREVVRGPQGTHREAVLPASPAAHVEPGPPGAEGAGNRPIQNPENTPQYQHNITSTQHNINPTQHQHTMTSTHHNLNTP